MKRIAIILAGLHYFPNYKKNETTEIDIDFRPYVDNITQHICGPFKHLYAIDFFICTNDSPILSELNVYNPVHIRVIDNPNHTYHLKKYNGMCDVFEYSLYHNMEYDFICMTRFDIYFTEPLKLDVSKLNIFSVLEHNEVICDNFYFFPGKMLPIMIYIFSNSGDKHVGHLLKNIFESLFEVHYIKNEYTYIHELTSYKLHHLSKITQLTI